MKLPVQAAAVPRGQSPLPASGSETAGVQPSLGACGTGYTCCPSNTNCAACCSNVNQTCSNGRCVANG